MSEIETEVLADILLDTFSVSILTASSERPVDVENLVKQTRMSRATAYRRLDRLVDVDLLTGRTWIDRHGVQRRVFEANFLSITIEITDGICYLHLLEEDDHTIFRLWDTTDIPVEGNQ